MVLIKRDIFHYLIKILVLYGAPEWVKMATGSLDLCSMTIVALKSYKTCGGDA